MSFFATEVVDEWGTSYSLTTAGYVTLVVAMLAIFLIGCAIFGKDKKIGAKQIAFSAMAIALAFVTSFLKIIDMPMGGSVTLLSMFFITLIGYWYGLGAGITCAVSYGLLQLIADPYIIPNFQRRYFLEFLLLHRDVRPVGFMVSGEDLHIPSHHSGVYFL